MHRRNEKNEDNICCKVIRPASNLKFPIVVLHKGNNYHSGEKRNKTLKSCYELTQVLNPLIILQIKTCWHFLLLKFKRTKSIILVNFN